MGVEIIQGDCLEEMAKLQAGSVRDRMSDGSLFAEVQ